MSVPFADVSVAPVAVLLASLAGSVHCAAMCGPLAVQASAGRGSMAAYHLGRGIAYVTLGALAGAIGGALLPGPILGTLSTVLLAAYFVWAAWRAWRGGAEPSLLPAAIARRLARPLARVLPAAAGSGVSALAAGLLTALLPCGWLHTFLVAAIAAGGAVSGAALMAAFWLGTVPALAGGTIMLRRAIAPLRRRHPGIVALCLLVAAGGTLWVRVAPPAKSTPDAPCHHHVAP